MLRGVIPLMHGRALSLFLFSSLLSIPLVCGLSDTFTPSQPVKDGDTIVSSGGTFEMGFFSPGNSRNRYVGIWYKNIPTKTVVWVANKEAPVANKSGMLKVMNPGVLVLVNDMNTILWSCNASRTSQNPIVQLLDSGNLVVRDTNDINPKNFLWQGFDFPSDTLLPGMKLGTDFVTGFKRYLTSWKSDDDPSPGDFTYECDPQGYPQNVLKKRQVEQYRSGPWNGHDFGGISVLTSSSMYAFNLVYNDKELSYSYKLLNSSILSRFTMNHTGVTQRWVWADQAWAVYFSVPAPDSCDNYPVCGAYGVCNTNNFPKCGCLDKFVPSYQNEWNRADWSKGCVRRKALDCKTDGFMKYSHVKLPDTRYSWFKTSTLKDCEKLCLKNCSCMAYANLGGNDCLFWKGDLLDIQESPSYTSEIYIRLAFSDLGTSGSHKKKGAIFKFMLPSVLGLVLVSLCLTLSVWRKGKKSSTLKGEDEHLGNNTDQLFTNGRQKEDLELPLFNLSEIAEATDNFSFSNKLGEGGYGPVYKGVMEDGREVAVKRLSKNSNQGLDEFKNEVICISKLQHRNLARLLGCCIQGDEKMLIYEYMPNKSLDYFIFDEGRSKLLDWPNRFNIINGIARGLQYLHEDSRLRIIHRDLKASNVLLDLEMNPKISDFGMARSFIGNETEANTVKVVGTYGYMSPEYAVDGVFSIKSDVFSFGVLVLEIVSGKKNRGFVHHDHHHNLLGHAWIRYQEGRAMEVIDANISDSCYLNEVLRSIELGLLCVQRNPEDRPSMSSVVVMLSSDGELPPPKQPGFFYTDHIRKSTHVSSSTSEITITQVYGR